MDKGIKVGKSVFYHLEDIPKDFQEEVQSILDNVKKIHGKNFHYHVRYLVNLTTFMNLVVQNTTIKNHVNEKDFQNAVERMLSELIQYHAEARGLDHKLHEEAAKAANTVSRVIKHFEKQLNDKGKH